jgi:hypothetical protein
MTKENFTADDFEAASAAFVAGLQERIDSYNAANFPTNERTVLSTMEGKRYVRIVRSSHGSRSVWGFLDKTTGDILKAAGWKAPAKIARGNIFAASQFDGCGVYGPAYIVGPNFDQFAA